MFAVYFMTPIFPEDFAITMTLTVPLDGTLCFLEIIRILVCCPSGFDRSAFVVLVLFHSCTCTRPSQSPVILGSLLAWAMR